MYTIGQLAHLARLKVETIRYYEPRGLLLPSSRKASGYRSYQDEALKVLLFI